MGFFSRCGAGNQKATVFFICFFHPRPSDRSTNEIGLHLPWHSATNRILTNGGSKSKFFPSHLKICGPFAEPGAFRHANARPQSTPLMGWGRSIRRSCHVGSCGSRSYHPSHRRMSWQWYAVIGWSLPCNAQPLQIMLTQHPNIMMIIDAEKPPWFPMWKWSIMIVCFS